MDGVREQHRSPLAITTYEGFVRSQLKRFGASQNDLDDLVQEVWLIALDRSPTFTEERPIRAWLSQVCRRVAAGARRSRVRTPLLPEEPSEPSVEASQVEHIEVELDERMRMEALSRLDERQLDVLTLYGAGDLPMREVAELVGEPEPTVYSRYRSAITELSRDLRRSEGARPKGSSFPPPSYSDSLHFSGDREVQADNGRLILYRADDAFVLGRIGNVIVARTRQRMFEASSMALCRAVDELYRRLQAPVVLINYLDPDLRLPNASERSAVRELIRVTSPQLAIVADVCDSPIVRIGSAIMQALMLITRSTTTFLVTPELADARRWVEPHAMCGNKPLQFERVVAAVQTLLTHP